MLKNSNYRITIIVPRYLKTPIDTYKYNRLFSIKYHPKGIISIQVPDLVHKIRNWVERETGSDPINSCKDRHGPMVTSRQLFVHFIKKYVTENNRKLTDSKIASIIDKDRTTLYHSEKCVLNHLACEQKYRDDYDRIEAYFISLNLEPV